MKQKFDVTVRVPVTYSYTGIFEADNPRAAEVLARILIPELHVLTKKHDGKINLDKTEVFAHPRR